MSECYRIWIKKLKPSKINSIIKYNLNPVRVLNPDWADPYDKKRLPFTNNLSTTFKPKKLQNPFSSGNGICKRIDLS